MSWVAQDDVQVLVAPADMLLAMKLNAARGRRDRDDITSLLVLCGVQSVADAEAVFDRYYPGEYMKDLSREPLVLELRP